MPDSSENDLAELKRHHETIFNAPGWQEFRTKRRDDWDQLIRRRAPQTLNPEAAQFLASTNTNVDIQSPDLEKDLHDRVSILLSNSQKIDAISLDSGTKAKEDVEEMRIVAAGSWMDQNDGFVLSRPLYENMVRYGVAVARKRAEMPDEPDDLSKDPKKGLKEREDYYVDSQEKCFDGDFISPLEVAWFPVCSEPSIVIRESIVPYVEMRELKNGEGKPLRMNKDGGIFWGEGIGSVEVGSGEWSGKFVNLIERAMRNDDGWDITKWVRGDKQGIDESKQLEEESSPFKHCPYFIAPGGDELTTETNPHLRYRPMIYPLLVDVQELNALVTLLVMTAVWHIQNPFYVRLDRMDAAQMSAIEGIAAAGLGVIQGAGAERAFVWRSPEAGSGEIITAPALEAMPNANLPEAFMTRIQQVQVNIQEHKANRYLVGEAFKETDDQPATSTLNQAEAAATPFGTYLTNGDKFTKDWLGAEFEAKASWQELMPKGVDKPFPYRTRGDEPVASGGKDSGEVITMTRRHLDRYSKKLVILTVTTRNETTAERAMREQLADVAKEKGALTREQWLKQRGFDNPQKQLEELWKADMEMISDQQFTGTLMQEYTKVFQALTGLNSTLTGPAGTAEGQEQTGAVEPQPGAASAPTPSPQPGVMNGRAPLVEGPTGGTSPAGVTL